MCCQESKKVPDVPEPFCVKKLFFCVERIHVIIDSVKISIDRFDRSALFVSVITGVSCPSDDKSCN